MTILNKKLNKKRLIIKNNIISPLFKYKSLNGDGLSHVLDILINKRLYLPSVNSLNDPFEVNTKMEDEENVKSRIKVLSFSKVRPHNEESIPMWAHYSNSFQGVSIEFDLDKLNKLFEKSENDFFFEKVKYLDNFFEDSYFSKEKSIEEGLLDYTFKKNKLWSYESEYRAVQIDKGPNTYLNNIRVEKIYFGARISELHKSLLTEICKQYDIKTEQISSKTIETLSKAKSSLIKSMQRFGFEMPKNPFETPRNPFDL